MEYAYKSMSCCLLHVLFLFSFFFVFFRTGTVRVLLSNLEISVTANFMVAHGSNVVLSAFQIGTPKTSCFLKLFVRI